MNKISQDVIVLQTYHLYKKNIDIKFNALMKMMKLQDVEGKSYAVKMEYDDASGLDSTQICPAILHRYLWYYNKGGFLP